MECPLSPRLSGRLYDQNRHKILTENRKSYVPLFRDISVSYHKSDKYTIIEIVYNSHHYHGLAACAPCDKYKNGYAGIATAYHRAFINLCEAIKP